MPTYEDFLKDLAKSDVYFSPYDLETAKGNPNFGYTALKYKMDVKNAATPEAIALANSGLEAARAQYGYSGGTDGSQYIPLSVDKPSRSYMDSYMKDYTDPNGYDAQFKTTLDEITNYKPFSYDVNADPLYKNYEDKYTRNGEMAMKNTLGQISARTGGLASSYAASAANQAYNNYMQALSDKIPELYQLAYQQYSDEYNRKVNAANLLDSARSTDYSRWQDDLGRLLNAFNISSANEAAALTGRGGGGGGGTVPPAETPEPISAALFQQLVNGDAATASQGLTTYWDRLTTAQRNILAREAGIPATMVRDGIGNNADDVSALLSLMTPQSPQPTAEQTLYSGAVSGIENYNDAVKVMKNYGLTETPSTKTDWDKAKGTWAKQFDTYPEYLKAWVYSRLT